jgi:hypothetical protein
MSGLIERQARTSQSGRTVVGVSLERLLNDSESPVRQFFRRRLPDLSGFRERWREVGEPSYVPWRAQMPWDLLLDYDNGYGIKKVAFYISRVPALIVWNVDDLLVRNGTDPMNGAT